MRFITPPKNQGQIVVVSYALTPDGIIKRVYDLSDQSEAYYATPWTRRLERWADSYGPQNSPPPAARWKKIKNGLLPQQGGFGAGSLGAVDEWKDTWNWAERVWGPDPKYALNRFFRHIAARIAEGEGLEEVGSSDVWHLTYSAVAAARKAGVRTQDELINYVRDYYGYY